MKYLEQIFYLFDPSCYSLPRISSHQIFFCKQWKYYDIFLLTIEILCVFVHFLGNQTLEIFISFFPIYLLFHNSNQLLQCISYIVCSLYNLKIVLLFDAVTTMPTARTVRYQLFLSSVFNERSICPYYRYPSLVRTVK